MRLRAAAVASTVLVCAAGLLVAPGDAQAAKPKSLAEVRDQVDQLYRQAEAATQAYDAVTERIGQQQADLVTLARAVVAAQSKQAQLTQRLGALARAQYRTGGGLPFAARFLLSSDPQSFLDGARLAEKGAQAATATFTALRTTRSELEGYANTATREWESLTAEQTSKADAKRQIEQRLARARALLGTLQAGQRERLQRLDEEAAYRSQLGWLKSDVGAELGRAAGTADALAARAVAFASAQLGKAYEWGAQGPSTYDCSGLTQAAWAAAGVTLPRTSQEQWAGLPHVPLGQLRPGDLIVYYADASHVAIYIGDGAVIQAPRPGRTVDIAGAGSMPILGAVRPG
ncbi:NlpC/P60 family protein [Streptantibioticus rubrisoli]|uniref:NlpC/P60 family protein n=1 Tax=Streptantibioticus rubrisoli TaxID=1387313 RepID=A0ABT1PK52_9ACTN|nr:NlpC/P60 family protein [Streptantibioticus rubrisoli]MCQ4045743.1 NlpC/P60 family protein [Streptantibioticus rubrisoli]